MGHPLEAFKLLTSGKTDLLGKFVSKRGRLFKAFLVLGQDGKVGFEFEPSKTRATGAEGKPPGAAKPAEKIDFTAQVAVGPCPKWRGSVFATEYDYRCEKSQAATQPCKFRMGRVILQRRLAPVEARNLLAEGRSDLLAQFVSKRGRPFSAWLVLDDAGKVGFEFPERDSAGGAG